MTKHLGRKPSSACPDDLVHMNHRGTRPEYFWSYWIHSRPRLRSRLRIPKVLRCADAVGSCDFVARGDSEQDILQQASEHAHAVHNINEITTEVAEKVKAAIRDEAA